MKILLLAGNTLRSKAYAQRLVNLNIELVGLFYGLKQKVCPCPMINPETRVGLEKMNIPIPDFNLNLRQTFYNNSSKFIEVDETDVNSGIIIKEITNMTPDLVIFSGYGGQILNANHFSSNIPYLHMHPGNIPEERGSTTIYYSILNQNNCTVTSFFMNEKIDAGKILMRKKYPIPIRGMNIDNYYDNSIRADCMEHTIRALLKGDIKFEYPSYEDSLEYYVIHPVLKHLAILSL